MVDKNAARRAYDDSVPREITTDDLAESFGVTHQTLSERVLRGDGDVSDHAFGENTGTPEPPFRLPTNEDAVAE